MRHCPALTLVLLSILCLAGCAQLTALKDWATGNTPKQAEVQGDPYQSDWLIARRQGQWQLVGKGAAGRMEKSAPNEEVLRLTPEGTVRVLSMPKLKEGEEIHCPAREREDYRQPCASAFLACEPDPGGLMAALWGGVSRVSLVDSRNRYACRADTNAILGAAKAVGMIDRIPPTVLPPPPAAAETQK